MTPHIGQALRPKTLSTVPRWCLIANRHLRVFYYEFGNLCGRWCPIYSPNSLSDVSFCSTNANSVKCSCKISSNLTIGGNASQFFGIWYKSHSAAFLREKSGFRERWFMAWSYLVVWRVWELISLCVCSRLSKKTAKRCANFCSLILKSISLVETKPEKPLCRSLFAVAGLLDYKRFRNYTRASLSTALSCLCEPSWFVSLSDSVSANLKVPRFLWSGFVLLWCPVLICTSARTAESRQLVSQTDGSFLNTI